MLEKIIADGSKPNTQLPDGEADRKVVPDNLRAIFIKMRDQHEIMQGMLPAADFPDYPDSPVLVKPYRMLRNDPVDVGVWGLCVGDNFEARISSIVGASGAIDLIGVRQQAEPKGFAIATEAEVAFVRTVLDFISENT